MKSKKCVHDQIDHCSNDLIKEIYSSFIPYTLDAAYALAHATDISTGNLISRNTSNRDKSPIVNSFGMQRFLQRVSFDGLTEKIKFDQFGDRGSAHYDIASFREGPVGDIKSVKRVLEGEWIISNKNKTNIDFYRDFIGRLYLFAPRNLPHLVVGGAFRVLVEPSAHLLVLKAAVNVPSKQCLTQRRQSVSLYPLST